MGDQPIAWITGAGGLIGNYHPHFRGLVKPGSLRDYQGAPRSPDTSLNCEKAQSLLDFKLPGLSEWLAHNQ